MSPKRGGFRKYWELRSRIPWLTNFEAALFSKGDLLLLGVTFDSTGSGGVLCLLKVQLGLLQIVDSFHGVFLEPSTGSQFWHRLFV